MCKGCLRNPITHSLGVSKRKMGTVYHKKQSKQHIPKIIKYKPILDQNNKTPGNGQHFALCGHEGVTSPADFPALNCEKVAHVSQN